MRLTRKVFTDLAIWMVAFGLGVGLLFPLFLVVLGVPAAHVLTPGFFAACLTAGAIAGTVNQALARLVVGSRLRLLAERMEFVAANLRDSESFDHTRCGPDQCRIPEDSDDVIGTSARAFNGLVHALAESYRTEQAVQSFSDLMVSRIELGPLAEEALQHLMHDTGAAGGALLLEEEGEMRVCARQGIREDQGFACGDQLRLAMKGGDIRLLQIPEGLKVDGVVMEFRPLEVFIVPILYKEVTLGVVVLASATPFPEGTRTRLEIFRRALSLALRNAIAHDNLQRLAALDPLTGVYNRRFGMQRLNEEFSRAVRADLPLAVLMVDIDHFKRINDTYGHLVGDRVLVKVARLVRSLLREGDVLLRYGGEEFMVILPGASCHDAKTLAQRLRHAVEDLVVTHGEQSFRVTVSIGAASYPEMNADTQEQFVHTADERLYRAKQSGRNCVVAA
ncbi:MAG: GGDEF domain-containing protein [Pseudomonadota bacterium]